MQRDGPASIDAMPNGSWLHGFPVVVMIVGKAITGFGSVLNQVQNMYNDFGQQTHPYQEHGGLVNTSTTPKVGYSNANGSVNTIRTTYQQRGTFQQQCGLDSVGWTFLSVDRAVLEWWIEDSANSDKNVQGTGNMVGFPKGLATITGTTLAWTPLTASQWNTFTEAQILLRHEAPAGIACRNL